MKIEPAEYMSVPKQTRDSQKSNKNKFQLGAVETNSRFSRNKGNVNSFVSIQTAFNKEQEPLSFMHAAFPS